MENITTKKITVGIIEDNKVISTNVCKYLDFIPDMEKAFVASSVEFYLDHLRKNPDYQSDVLLLDIGLPGMSGLNAIPILLEKQPSLDIIMLTTFEEEEIILKALCSGAVGYISKKTSLEEIMQGIRVVDQGGSYMSPQIAREITQYLLRGQTSKSTMSNLLSPRKMEIIERLVDGKSYQQIADDLFISLETVRSHVKALYKILHVNNKAEAIAMYLKGEIK